MTAEAIYIPGRSPGKAGPFARYLPPLPEGVAARWLEAHLPPAISKGAQAGASPAPCIIDPFGASPQLAVEAARAGYRVFVTANNPVARFLLEMAVNPPTQDQLQAVLAELASSRRGGERLEPHIRSLYLTACDQCGQEVMVDAFLWERGPGTSSGASPTLFGRIYHCEACGKSGEFPAAEADIERAWGFSTSGLHRARALERVVSMDDPDRQSVEEALAVYLPRAVYVLFTMINRLDGLALTELQRKHLAALLLSACDQANTLWPYPTGRARPRQLTIPPRFRENNIWLALEQAVEELSVQPGEGSREIPLTIWPEQPPAQGGICLFEGRLRELSEQFQAVPSQGIHIEAVMAALPRPNQAFWTLSALWAGWLWGREAVGPFKSVLRRRRYDWSWHTVALRSALESLHPLLEANTPFLGLIGETEPGFLAAAILAAGTADFELEGLALRAESGQAQITWRSLNGPAGQEIADHDQHTAVEVASQAAKLHLQGRGEPCGYLYLQAAALSALAQAGLLSRPVEANAEAPPAHGETLGQLNAVFEEAFSYRKGFLRFGGSEKSLDVGQWWLRESLPTEAPLADRVEMSLVRHLQQNPGTSLLEADRLLCEAFPGLYTPSPELIQVCLESYGQQDPDDPARWHLRPEDVPHARRADLGAIHDLLDQIAGRIGFRLEGQGPVLWLDAAGNTAYACYVIDSAVFGEILSKGQYPPDKVLIVLPGGRANLAAYKLKNDPRLQNAVEGGWRFIKYRQVRWLAENAILNQEMLEAQLEKDLLTYNTPQMRLL
jgi:hypothetical protein